MNISDEEIEISFESSTNKLVKKSYVRRVPSHGAKVSFIFGYHSSGFFIHLFISGFKLCSCGKQYGLAFFFILFNVSCL